MSELLPEFSHCVPVCVSGHRQKYSLAPNKHLPPFIHGCESHTLDGKVVVIGWVVGAGVIVGGAVVVGGKVVMVVRISEKGDEVNMNA